MNPSESKKPKVFWTDEEEKIVAMSLTNIIINNPGISLIKAVVKSMHTNLPPDRWRSANNNNNCRTILSIFKTEWQKIQEKLGSNSEPELITVHTVEEVMLPPEQSIKHTSIEIIMQEVGIRMGGLMRDLSTNFSKSIPKNDEITHNVELTQQPRVVEVNKRRYQVAVIGLLREQFNTACENVYDVPVLKEMFDVIYVDKPRGKLVDLGRSINYVICIRFCNHRTGAEAVKQLGNKKFVRYIYSVGQLVPTLMDIRSQVLAIHAIQNVINIQPNNHHHK